MVEESARLTTTLTVLNQLERACQQDDRLALEQLGNFYDEALYYACLYGKTALVVWLMKEKQAKAYPLGLYGACRGGMLYLAARMYRLDKDHMGEALYHACIGGHKAMIDWTINHGATEWNRGLEGACVGSQVDAAVMMIQRGATAVEPLRQLSSDPLHQVVQQAYWHMSPDQKEFVKDLPKPAPVQPVDGKRISTLEIACRDRDRRKISQFGRPELAFVYVCQYGHRDLAEWILPQMDDGTLDRSFAVSDGLFQACEHKDWEMIRWLITINGCNRDMGIRGALLGGHPDVFEWLLQNGAKFAGTSTVYAARSGNLELVKRLMNRYVMLPKWILEGACLGGHMAMVRFILEKAPDEEYDWDFALRQACIGGNVDIVQLCMEKGADKWDAGLLSACAYGQQAAAMLMLQNGAEVTPKVFKWSCRSGNIQLIRMIIELGGLPPKPYDVDTETVIMASMGYVCEGGWLDIIELLIDHGVTYWSGFQHIPRDDMAILIERCYSKMSPDQRECVFVRRVLEPQIRQAMTQLGMPKKMRHGNY